MIKSKCSTFVCFCVFCIYSLLLTTPNYSVVISILFSFLSLYLLIEKKESVNLSKTDWVFIIACCSYFICFIPVALSDGTTLRYFDAPIRFLLCIPIYLCLKMQFAEGDLLREKVGRHLEYGAIAGSLGALIIALYQTQILNMPRVDGFLFSINFGYLSCALAFLCLVFFKKSKHKVLNFIAFSCAIVAMLLTLTRGAIIAAPILLITTLLLQYRESITLPKVILFTIILIGGATSAYQCNDKIQTRTDYTIFEMQSLFNGNTIKATSSGGRIELWIGAIHAFKNNPLFGTSYDEREIINQDIYNAGKYTNPVILVSRGHAHSQYFEALASTGLLGISALILYLFLPLAYYYHLFLKNKNNIFALNGFIFTLGICIYGLTEVLLEANSISTFYAVTQAILLSLAVSFTYDATDNPLD